MKRISSAVIACALCASLMLGCNSSMTPNGSGMPGNGATGSKGGVFKGTAKGFEGDVTVTLTIQNNMITSAEAIGPNETETVGGRALRQMPASMIAANSVRVDGISGATYTSNAILEAASKALKQSGVRLAAKKRIAEQNMTPGTYYGEAYGKWPKDSIEGKRFGCPAKILPTKVAVTVDARKILGVTVENCSDTPGFIEPCIERIPKAVVDRQSVNVDVVTGCTLTSQAILSGVSQALKQAGADLNGFSSAVPKKSGTETYDVDVVIVGAGAAGTVAALQAMESGAKYLVLEKCGKLGGQGVCSTGPMAVGSKMQTKAGSTITVDEVFNNMMEYADWKANAPLVYNILSVSGRTIDWLQSYWDRTDNPGFVAAPKSNGLNLMHMTGKGTAKYNVLYDKFINAAGKNLLLETTAKSLIMDGDVVAGVNAVKQDGTKVAVRAKKVILATGGFGGNKEMLETYFGRSDYYLNGLSTNSGDGVRMALDAGAVMSEELMPHLAEFCANDRLDYYAGFMKFINQLGLLMLDPDGERYMNEELCITSSIQKGASAMRRVGYSFVILTKDTLDKLTEKGLWGILSNDLIKKLEYRDRIIVPSYYTLKDEMKTALAVGEAWESDTLKGLGEAISASSYGMDTKNFNKSIEAYKKVVAAGKDTLFGKRAELLAPLEDNHYYAVRITSPIDGTLNGIKVNSRLQAVNRDFKPIPNLYIAGQDGGGYYSYPYYEYVGSTMCYAFNSGYLAAKNAIEELRGTN